MGFKSCLTKAYIMGCTVGRVAVGYQFLLFILFGLAAPLSPLLALLFVIKKLEQLCFFTLYNATPIIASELDTHNRIILVVLNGRIASNRLQECFVQNIIDSHNENGDIRFPNVTRALASSWFHKYWIDERRFLISDHIKVFSDETITFQDIPTLLTRIQRARFEDTKGNTLSPWLINIYYLDNNQSAVFFKIDQSLDVNTIIRTLFSKAASHRRSKRIVGNFASLCDQGSLIDLCKHVGLAGWLLLRRMTTLTKNKFSVNFRERQEAATKNKKTYLCSKSVDTSSFQQLGYHFGVSARYLILSCVTLVIDESSFRTVILICRTSILNLKAHSRAESKSRR